MRAYCFSRRQIVRQSLVLAALAGLVLLLATMLVRAAENTKTKDADTANSKDPKTPPKAPTVPKAGPDDSGPPGPPPDDGQGRPRPPHSERRPGEPDDRQRGGSPFGPGGPPNRPGSFGLGQMEKNDPELEKLIKVENDLDRRTHEAANDYREASKDQRAKLKEDLKKLVTQQFESRQQRRKLELTRFEEELKRLREATDRREKDRQRIIEKRVSDLLGEDADAGF